MSCLSIGTSAPLICPSASQVPPKVHLHVTVSSGLADQFDLSAPVISPNVPWREQVLTWQLRIPLVVPGVLQSVSLCTWFNQSAY